MTRFTRILMITSALALTLPLAGCDSFDPTDLFSAELFNAKKKLPGDRKPIFPEGVPGVARGVPSDLVKGANQPPPGAENPQQAVAPAEEPKPKPKAAPKPKPKVAAKPAPAPDGSRPTAVTVRPSSNSPWPDGSQSQPEASQPAAAPASPRSPGQIMWPDPPSSR